LNTFDKNIKKKLYNAEVKVSDGMWASIESQIPVKKERPKIWLLFLMMAFTIPYLIVLNSSSKLPSGEESVELIKDQQSALTGNTNKQSEKLNAASSSPTSNKRDIYSNIDAEENNSKLNNYPQSAVTGANSDNGVIALNKDFSPIRRSQNLQQTRNNITINNKNNNQPTADIVAKISSISSVANFDSEAKKASSKKLTFLNNPFTKGKKTGTQREFKLIEKSRIYKRATSVNKATALSERYYKGGLCYDHTERRELFGKRLEMEKASVAVCPTFDRQTSGFYIFGDISTGYSFQSLSPKSPDHINYVAQRNNDEQGALSISANIGIGKKWANGMLLETGLNYDRINTNASKYLDEQSMTMIITYDTIMTSSGTVTSIDTSFINHQSDKSKFNNFTQFNFPVSLGYDMPVSERFSLVGKAGVLFNISSYNSGTLINQEGDSFIYNSSRTDANYFRTNLGLSFTGSLQSCNQSCRPDLYQVRAHNWATV